MHKKAKARRILVIVVKWRHHANGLLLGYFFIFRIFHEQRWECSKILKKKLRRLDLGVVEHLSMKWVVRRQRPDSPQPKQDAPELFSGLTAFNTPFPPQKEPDCPLNLIRLLLLVLQVPNQLLANYILKGLKASFSNIRPQLFKRMDNIIHRINLYPLDIAQLVFVTFIQFFCKHARDTGTLPPGDLTCLSDSYPQSFSKHPQLE